jgi:hypothetical protein
MNDDDHPSLAQHLLMDTAAFVAVSIWTACIIVWGSIIWSVLS